MRYLVSLLARGAALMFIGLAAYADSEPEGIRLLEVVEKSPDEAIAIPYRKYVLDNGLTVILHEARSERNKMERKVRQLEEEIATKSKALNELKDDFKNVIEFKN